MIPKTCARLMIVHGQHLKMCYGHQVLNVLSTVARGPGLALTLRTRTLSNIPICNEHT